MVAVGGNLVLTGGSKGKYLYADEPGKAQLLRRRSNRLGQFFFKKKC